MKFKTKLFIFLGAFIGYLIAMSYYAVMFFIIYQFLKLFTSFSKVIVTIVGCSLICALFHIRQKENEED